MVYLIYACGAFMGKKNFSKKERILTMILLTMTVVMLLATFVSLGLFRHQMDSATFLDYEQTKTYEKHYALIVDNPNDSLWDPVYEQMQKVGDDLNIYVERFGTNLAVSYSKTDLLRIAIESKVDGIILEGDETDETTALIYKANLKEIPVVTILHDCVGSGRVSFVGINNYSFGTEYGSLITTAAEEIRRNEKNRNRPIRVLLLLDGLSRDNSQNIIYTAMQETLENDDDPAETLIIDTERINSLSVFRTEEKIRDIVVNSTNLPDIIVCLNEQNTSSVYQTLVDQNKVGQIYVIGYFDSDAILKAIDKKGIYATVTIDAKQMGKYCVEALNEYALTGYVSDYMSVDFTCIDAANVRSYLGEEVEHETP